MAPKYLILFLMLIPIVVAEPISMDINTPQAIIRSTDNLLSQDIQNKGNGFEVEICWAQMPGVALTPFNLLTDLQRTLTKINATHQDTTIIGRNGCQTYTLPVRTDAYVQIGTNTTIVYIDDMNVTFTVDPETDDCDYVKCQSDIILHNIGVDNVTFHSSNLTYETGEDIHLSIFRQEHKYPIYQTIEVWNPDLNATVSESNQSDIIGYMNHSVPIPIEQYQEQILILPGDHVHYTLTWIGDPLKTVKYNVSLWYQDIEYKIDPFFITDNSTFPNGEFVNGTTLLNESGFVQHNQTSPGTYLSEVFDAGAKALWKSFTWIQGHPYQKSEPDNQANETLMGGIDMAENGLLYHLEESSGIINDSSGNGITASPNGGVLFNQSGRYGKAAFFDGIDDFFNLTPDFVGIMTPTFSATAWFNPRQTNKLRQTIISRDIVDRSRLGMNDSGHLYCLVNVNGTKNLGSTDNDKFKANKWNHAACTYNGSRIFLYLNGKLVDSLAASGNHTPGVLPLKIGRCLGGFCNAGGEYFNGTLDEIALYSRFLDEEEIIDRYKRGILNLSMQVRACEVSDCSDRNDFDQEFTDPQNVTIQINETKFFQYEARLTSENLNYTAELWNVSTQYILGINNCELSSSPLIQFNRRVPFLCNMSNMTKRQCVASIKFDGTVLSTSPKTSAIEGIGYVSSFQTQNGLLHGYYEQDLLRSGQSFDLTIQCGSNIFSTSITPQQKGLEGSGNTLIWWKDNQFFYIAAIVFILIVIFGLIALWRFNQ